MAVDAMYCSVWDGGMVLESACKVNTKTKQITGIKDIFDVDVGVLEDEFILINEEKHPCARMEEVYATCTVNGKTQTGMRLEGREDFYWYK